MSRHFVYLLCCADDTLYCGYATDVSKRLATHNSGKGAKYTRGRLPVKVIYTEELPTKGDALRREYEIKQLSRTEKLALAAQYQKVQE